MKKHIVDPNNLTRSIIIIWIANMVNLGMNTASKHLKGWVSDVTILSPFQRVIILYPCSNTLNSEMCLPYKINRYVILILLYWTIIKWILSVTLMTKLSILFHLLPSGVCVGLCMCWEGQICIKKGTPYKV